MRKLSVPIMILATIFAYSCGGNSEADKAKLKEEHKEELLSETEKSQTDKTSESKTASAAKTEIAKFQMMVANTAGTSYFFKTASGEELQLFPDINLKGMEFANSLQPGSTDHTYFDKDFELTYEIRNVETTAGDAVDRLFLLEVKESGEAKQSGITLDELKKIKFSGVEPAWTVTFKDKNIEYSFGYEPNPIKMVYYGDHDGSNQRMKVISANEVQIRFIHESALDKGFINVATIKKEACSDGMSDNTYPYSIHVQEEERVLDGCGRVK